MARPRAEVEFTGFTGTDRFEVVRALGGGGMGVVYEAFDREHNCRVALKTLRSMSPEALRRFKSEFRSLQGFQHPNLVGLGELLEEDGRLLFTMELVRGVDFLVHVQVHEDEDSAASADAPIFRKDDLQDDLPPTSISRFGPASVRPRGTGRRFDEGRLRRAFGQLALGVAALHAAGKVHRDIKPGNALVTADGRVVLLDFGLVADAEGAEGIEEIVGTAYFMAPEQAAGRPVGPEADWYSMGVILDVALTGAYPFDLSPRLALEAKQREDPPPPDAIASGLPRDLVELCMGLLRRDPAERPEGAEVLRRLGLAASADGPALSRRSDPFVGRRRELDALHAALADTRAGRPVTVLIEGEPGLGKSALLRHFLEQIAGDAQVLSGRCYERELLPFKAVDEVFEALHRSLSRLPEAEREALLPPDTALLGEVFPALAELGAQDPEALGAQDPEAQWAQASEAQGAGLTPRETRARVVAALREIFRRLAAERPLVLAIEDLQWADSEGLCLLADLVRPPGGPPMLLVATRRTGSGVSPGAERWALPGEGAAQAGGAALLPGEVRLLELRELAADSSPHAR